MSGVTCMREHGEFWECSCVRWTALRASAASLLEQLIANRTWIQLWDPDLMHQSIFSSRTWRAGRYSDRDRFAGPCSMTKCHISSYGPLCRNLKPQAYIPCQVHDSALMTVHYAPTYSGLLGIPVSVVPNRDTPWRLGTSRNSQPRPSIQITRPVD